MVVSIVAVQVRLTGVPSYSVVVLEVLMVRVTWERGTNVRNIKFLALIAATHWLC